MASVNPQSVARSNERSDSLRSVSSTNSAVSLTRRSRVRTRSSTISDQRGWSLGPPDEEKESANNLSVELVASYPLQSQQPGPSRQENQVLSPSRPPKSPRRIVGNSEMGIVASKIHKRPSTVETPMTTERGRNQLAGPSQLKGAIRPRSLPRQIRSFSSESESFLEYPIQLPISNGSNHQGSNIRDSLLSQQSGTSSSVYPPSTATLSKRDRTLSPTSYKGKERDDDIPPLEQDDHGYQDFDADDVSLRLRLLVKNNYFLPPAHSKPSAADFTNSNATKPKASSPGFLDLFRIGKSKSKPTTPVAYSPPAEYTTDKMKMASNGTPAPNFRQQQSLPQASIAHAQPGRVVVVREKMQDLVGAAKQAELESKNRGDRNGHPSKISKKRLQEEFDGVIDPTDSVDLPPLSGNYPFALQASAMQGLGVQDSIGAAVLADHLPPSQSPVLWSGSIDEEIWRKRILQQAVGHSFSNTTVSSFTRKSSGGSTTTGISVMTTHPKGTLSSELDYESASSPASIRSSSPHPPLGQPIVPQAVLSRHVQHSPSMSKLVVSRPEHPPSPRLLRKFSAPEFQQGAWNSFDPPLRAESPLYPTIPLAPAPRKPIFNPVYSLSQSDLRDPLEVEPASSPVRSAHSSSKLRDSFASDRLLDVHETEVNTGRSVMSPPPVFVRGPEGSPILPSHRPPDSETSGSHYFEDDDIEETWYGTPGDSDDLARLSASLPTTSRPSFSDLPYASPTVSAFRDAIFDDHRSISSLQPDTSGDSSVQSFVSAMSAPRYSMASPPPRTSNSFAVRGLPPPPRRRRHPSEQDRTEMQDRVLIMGPEPTAVPFPNSDRRRNRLSSLHIPTLSDSQVKSAPPDSSISFFDSIQSDLNEIDEDSDSASDEGVPQVYVDSRTKAIYNRPSISSTRPTFMRLGNNSLPQLGSYAGTSAQYPPFDPLVMKAPIVNVPEKPTFFASRKGGKSKQGISPLDFAPPPRISSSTLSGRSSPSSLPGRKRSGSQVSEFVVRVSQDESKRNLDGLVMKHLEAERDTLARIAANTRTNRDIH